MAFITEMKCVYCAVRTESLNKFRIYLRPESRAMAQAAVCRPLTSEGCVLSQVSPRGKCGTGTDLSPSTFVFLCRYCFSNHNLFHTMPVSIHMHLLSSC